MNTEIKELALELKALIDKHGIESVKEMLTHYESVKAKSQLARYSSNDIEKVRVNRKLHEITPGDVQQIAERYKVSIGFVQYQYECLINYCESKGKTYKDYKAALRNFVIKSLGQMAENKANNKKGGIDGRGL